MKSDKVGLSIQVSDLAQSKWGQVEKCLNSILKKAEIPARFEVESVPYIVGNGHAGDPIVSFILTPEAKSNGLKLETQDGHQLESMTPAEGRMIQKYLKKVRREGDPDISRRRYGCEKALQFLRNLKTQSVDGNLTVNGSDLGKNLELNGVFEVPGRLTVRQFMVKAFAQLEASDSVVDGIVMNAAFFGRFRNDVGSDFGACTIRELIQEGEFGDFWTSAVMVSKEIPENSVLLFADPADGRPFRVILCYPVQPLVPEVKFEEEVLRILAELQFNASKDGRPAFQWDSILNHDGELYFSADMLEHQLSDIDPTREARWNLYNLFRHCCSVHKDWLNVTRYREAMDEWAPTPEKCASKAIHKITDGSAIEKVFEEKLNDVTTNHWTQTIEVNRVGYCQCTEPREVIPCQHMCGTCKLVVSPDGVKAAGPLFSETELIGGMAGFAASKKQDIWGMLKRICLDREDYLNAARYRDAVKDTNGKVVAP